MSDTDEALYRRYRAEDNDADLEALLARHRCPAKVITLPPAN